MLFKPASGGHSEANSAALATVATLLLPCAK